MRVSHVLILILNTNQTAITRIFLGSNTEQDKVHHLFNHFFHGMSKLLKLLLIFRAPFPIISFKPVFISLTSKHTKSDFFQTFPGYVGF